MSETKAMGKGEKAFFVAMAILWTLFTSLISVGMSYGQGYHDGQQDAADGNWKYEYRANPTTRVFVTK